MKRNCNLELRLVSPSTAFNFSDHHSMDDKNQKKTQQLTIFYNGKVASCDATELQARAIILLASREIDEKSTDNSSPAPAALNSPVYSAATGLSMKRSLQRFLEKRKSRAISTAPYSVSRQ